MRTLRCAGALVAAVVVLAGCASAGRGPSAAEPGASSGPAGSQPASPAASSRQPSSQPPQPAIANGLVVLHDPGQVTGGLTGPCHASDSGRLPDQRCTPGGIDPAVTQASIQSTICTSGYTSTIRPPEAQTEAFKFGQAYPAYGITSGTQTELDHLVPLELGGDNDAANLWPELPPSPNPKDSVENALNAAVCAGRVSLASAQRAIAQNWQTAEANLGIGAPPPAPAAAPSPAPAGAPGLSCSASVSNNSPPDYSTVDITVRTAAGASVTTTARYKTTSNQKTSVADASGVATIAYYISGATPGYTVAVDVSVAAGSQAASCSTSFTPVA